MLLMKYFYCDKFIFALQGIAACFLATFIIVVVIVIVVVVGPIVLLVVARVVFFYTFILAVCQPFSCCLCWPFFFCCFYRLSSVTAFVSHSSHCFSSCFYRPFFSF